MIRNAFYDPLLLPTLSPTDSTRLAHENVGPWGSCLDGGGNGVRDPTGRRGDDDGFTAVAAPPTRPLFSNMKRSRDSPGDRRIWLYSITLLLQQPFHSSSAAYFNFPSVQE